MLDTRIGPPAGDYSDREVPLHVMSQAAHDTVLVVVGEAPGRQEDKLQEPFVGDAGRLLRKAYIGYFELDQWADIALTHAVRFRPMDNRTPKAGEITHQRPALVSDLKDLSSRYNRVVILAAGATAAKTFGFRSLTEAHKSQGSRLDFNGVSCWFFCTYNPAAILRDDSVSTALEAHLTCLRRFLSGEAPTEDDPEEYTTNPTIEHVFDGNPNTLCIDIETYGAIRGQDQTQFHPVKSLVWDKIEPSEAVVSSAISWDGSRPGSGFFNLTVPAHRRRFSGILKEAQRRDIVLLFHNAVFDVTFLRRFLPACRPFLAPPTRFADLMVASYLVHESRPERSLKALAPLLLGHRGLYSDSQRELDFSGPTDPTLARYNVADTRRTLECWRLCRESYPRLYTNDTGKGHPYSDRWYSDLLHLVVDLSEAGTPINVTKLSTLDERLRRRKSQLERAAKVHADMVLEGKGSDKSKRGAMSDALELASASDSTVSARVQLTKTGRVPFDAETRSYLLSRLSPLESPDHRYVHRQLRVMGRHQSISKIINSYTAPLLQGRKRGKRVDHAPRIIQGRVYPIWIPVPREFGSESGGTKQGRLAARSPSVPTFPPTVKDTLSVDMWVDYSQIELRVAALLSGDETMMGEYSGAPDLHGRTARLLFGDGIIHHPRYHEIYRQAGKACNFLMLYRGGAKKLRETLLSSPGIDFPLDSCYDAIERFWSTYHGLRRWQDRLIATSTKAGWYELPLTGQSRSFDRNDPSINEICNFPVQAVAANITLSAQCDLLSAVAESGVGMRIVANIYDAIGIEIHPREKARYKLTRVQQVLDRVLPSPRYYDDLCAHVGRRLPLEYETKVCK